MAKHPVKQFLLILLVLLTSTGSIYATSGDTVTVAYIDYDNFLEKDENGSYAGYAADYLNRIASYTNWDYEFLDMTWADAYEAVKDNEVDFYCVARQSKERQKDFDFSLYPVCNEEMTIYALPESDIYYQDYKAMDGKRIGMLEQSGEIDYFKKYSSDHNFSCTIVQYPMNEDAIKAMDNGDVDMVGLVNYSIGDNYKALGNFGVSPAYMMSAKDSPHMKAFNDAQQKLYFDDLSFTSKLDEKYYSNAVLTLSPMLTREEASFIEDLTKSGTTLDVAISKDMAPIEYFDSKTKSFKGLTIDLFNLISKLSGLEFNFVYRDGNTKATIIGAQAKTQVVEQSLNLIQTTSFTDNTLSVVSKDISKLNSDSVIAIPSGYPVFAEQARKCGFNNVIEYSSFEECIKAVNKGKADLCFVISMCEGYLLGHPSYTNLESALYEGLDYGICFGVDSSYDPRLLSIINKCFEVITNRQINDLIITNTSLAVPKESLLDFLVKNVLIVMVVFFIIIALVAVMIIWFVKGRQQKRLNQKLQQHRDYLQHLYDTLPCGIFRYEYDPPHRIIGFNASCARIYGYEDDFAVIGQTPDAVVEQGTEQAFQEKFDTCIKEGGTITYDWPITRRDGSQAYTESVMDIVQADNKKVFQEVIIDITQRKLHELEIQRKYNKEVHRSKKQDQDLLYTACFDITRQIVAETDIDSPNIYEGMSISEFTDCLSQELKGQQTPLEMEDFKTRFSAQRLNHEYENDHFEFSFDLCREYKGQIQWLRSNLALRHNPINGNLMCFDYIYDITDEMVTKNIVQKMAFTDCEDFVSVFLSTGKCLQYAVSENASIKRLETRYLVDDILSGFCEQMTMEDVKQFRSAIDLSCVKQRLQETPHYQVSATLYNMEGQRMDKSISFFYTNKDGGVLAYTVVDVTEIKASEVRHAKLLSDALYNAEKADRAKSRFLSSVSHEMRTPLNAILGFIELAKDASNDGKKVANCLASSDLAAKQLLNVINDVLDMSSIESGKMKIDHSSFNFRHLISSITNIYGTQCKQKGINFEVRINTLASDWLVGDELRVNQILMNLLGNAVKFTSEGQISLDISQTDVENNKVFIRFIISDTGCGMTEEMQSRLFKPFEQESASTSRKFGGSGLGLSIVKNLLTLMNGEIAVKSKQGLGTTFIVDIPFDESDVNAPFILPKKIDTLHVLSVDDTLSEREYMSLVLTRMGVRFKTVDSGDEALKEMEKAQRKNDLYNVCLVDWKMPGIDGCETIKRLRAKYSKDLILIVVSAYDFQQAGDIATKAGANLFMSKPIFQSTLFDLFMTITGGKIAHAEKKPLAWDFSSKRALLAEDNQLNQIVAKGYLARFNLVVDLANDGQQALEKFEASEKGYYDAILMDVQMPIMDGYQATKAIRASSHPQGRTIPIIAQSADAFTEDIAKALSAGMNDHVSKPINPDTFAKALYKAFNSNCGENYD